MSDIFSNDRIFDFDKELNSNDKNDISSDMPEMTYMEPVYHSSLVPKDKELSISKTELDSMPSYELESFAKNKAKYILGKIQSASEKVEKAKESAASASEISGLWSTRKKTDKNTETTLILADAIQELNEIVQESIKFTCLSIEFAKCMTEQISTLMVSGFQDSSGHIVRLNANSKEQAKIILQNAEHFSSQQLEIKQRQSFTEQRLSNLSNQIDDSSQKFNQYDALFENYANQIAELRNMINDQNFKISQLESEVNFLKGLNS